MFESTIPPIVRIYHDMVSTDFEVHNHYEDIILDFASHESVSFFESEKNLRVLQNPDIHQYVNTARREDWYELIGDAPMIHHDLKGFHNSEIIYLKSGELELISGRTFTGDEVTQINDSRSTVAIISYPFAVENNLSVGNTFTLYLSDNDDIYFNFEIIGIRDFIDQPELLGTNPYQTMAYSVQQNIVENYIYVPALFVSEVTQKYVAELLPHLLQFGSAPVGIIEAYFLLHSFNDIPTFINDIEKVLSENGMLNQHTEIVDYSERFAPLIVANTFIQEISDNVFYSSILVAVFILFIIFIFNIGERKKELSIYLILGENKRKIYFQYLMEAYILTGISVFLSVILTPLLLTPVSRQLLSTQLLNYQNNLDPNHWPDMTLETVFGFNQLTVDDFINSFYVTFNLFELSILILAIFTFITITVLIIVKYYLSKKLMHL